VRVGRHGVPFKLYKFRSMVVNADKIGAGITTAHDPRITPIGRFLRRTKLDELPQLINVLRGEMSLVGPRPEDPRYVALYTEEQRRVLRARPGMTSLASVRYRNEQALLSGDDWETRYIQQIMPDKLAIDLQYIERATLLSDLGVLWQTFLALFR
jgi:lipopolysaccharide/colanic/teichoic acid biosynthesis glycosyltransferase